MLGYTRYQELARRAQEFDGTGNFGVRDLGEMHTFMMYGCNFTSMFESYFPFLSTDTCQDPAYISEYFVGYVFSIDEVFSFFFLALAFSFPRPVSLFF